MILGVVWKSDTQTHRKPHTMPEIPSKQSSGKEQYLMALSTISELYSEGSESSLIKQESQVSPTTPGPGVGDDSVASSADVDECTDKNKKKKMTDDSSDSKEVKSLETKAGTSEETNENPSHSVSFGAVDTMPAWEESFEAGTVKEDATTPTAVTKEEVDVPHARRASKLRSQRSAALRARKTSNYVFVVLILSCILVCIWKYPILSFLLAPLLLWVVLSRVLYPYARHHLQLWHRTRVIVVAIASCSRGRKALLFPPPISTLGRMFLYADHMILRLAIQSVGSIVTVCIIVGLVVGLTSVFVLVLLQIQVELSHYVTVSMVVWNKTLEVNPRLVE